MYHIGIFTKFYICPQACEFPLISSHMKSFSWQSPVEATEPKNQQM